MRWAILFPIAAVLFCGCATIVRAEDKASPTAAIRASSLTQEQFKALLPEALIEINGERTSKREFTEQRAKALEQAVKEMNQMKAKAHLEFEARRKAFLDAEKTKLEEANKAVEVEVARFVAADAVAHGRNWEARKKQAAAILSEAAIASTNQRSQLEKQANDLLSGTSLAQ